MSETSFPDAPEIGLLYQWTRGETPGPRSVIVYPTDRCNLKCAMCWRQAFSSDPSKELPDSRWLELVDEAADMGAAHWIIVGGGEPMVRLPLFMEICRRVCRRGLDGAVQNNGTLYTAQTIEELVAMGWSNVIISLDGSDTESNDRIRGKGAFEKATRALRTFAEVRRRTGGDRPWLSLYTTVTKDNYTELPRMVELAYELGIDGTRAGYVVGQWCKDMHLQKAQLSRMPDLIAQARQRAVELGMKADLNALELGWRRTMRGPIWRRIFGPSEGLAGALCFYPWHSLEVRADGSIGPCCQAHDVNAPTVHETSLQDVWTGPYMTALRQRILENKPMPYCAECQVFLQRETERIRRLMQWNDVWGAYDRLGLKQRAAIRVWDVLMRGKKWLRNR